MAGEPMVEGILNKNLKAAYEIEMQSGKDCFGLCEYDRAFHHFERAHILGQFYVSPHVRSHIWMLFIGIRRRNAREIRGQLIRIPLAMIGSALGKVPVGNTGGADLKLSTSLPIPDDLKKYLDASGKDQGNIKVID